MASAVSTMKSELLKEGIKLDVCGPSQHVPKVENKVKVYKTRVRAHNAGLPFIMTLKLLIKCVLFCVFCVNLQPVSGQQLSPFERYWGRKLDAA
jgi:hypothetical protein